MRSKQGVPLRGAVLTDIVKVDCFAINSHGELRSLPLLRAFLLAPDIANCVCATGPFAVEGPREGREHIWLLDVERGCHSR